MRSGFHLNPGPAIGIIGCMSTTRLDQAARAAVCLLPLVLVACQLTLPDRPAVAAPGEAGAAPEQTVGQELVVCGERVEVGAPVVLWTDPGGYDATSTSLHFDTPGSADSVPEGELRYQPGRVSRDGRRQVLIEPESVDRTELGRVVDQLVLHYDACGLSRTCFKVLHDRRGLSCHFLLDVDGTIYQTMDLRDQAWHATRANVRSIGVEIANIGAFTPGRPSPLDQWYAEDTMGLKLQLPQPNGVRTVGFAGRPARSQRIKGTINDGLYEMVDLTPQQYDSLVALTAALCRTFPELKADVPRTPSGEVLQGVLEDAAFESFRGILGHFHVQRNKIDPGPAFQWEEFLTRVRALMGERLP